MISFLRLILNIKFVGVLLFMKEMLYLRNSSFRITILLYSQITQVAISQLTQDQGLHFLTNIYPFEF